MALIKCPECGKEISDKSDKCIHCGFPLRTTPIIQENINGQYYDVNFLTDKSITQPEKIMMLRKLTNYEIDLMDAKKLVFKYHPSQQQNTKKVVDNTPKCPTCGSTNIQKISGTKRWLSAGLFGLASSDIGKSMVCKSCGYKW